MTAKRTKSFNVYARLNLEVSVEISAKDLEEAVAKTKELKTEDFVNFLGEYTDGAMKITGIFENRPDIEDGL